MTTPSRWIALDTAYVRSRGRRDIEREVKRIVRSNRFELSGQGDAFRLLGPDTSYHDIDPCLPGTLAAFGSGMRLADILSFRSAERSFDLCFEDSWSGYFLAERDGAPQSDLVLIHLDDHTDMMSSLLELSGGALTDPATGAGFDPARASDWVAAIHSGSVGIGSFVTPLFFSGRQVHVRHLNNDESSDHGSYSVLREPVRFGLIPGRQFAAVSRVPGPRPERAGTYRGGADARRLLRNIPAGRIVVHIDLDYFINDFNGNADAEFRLQDPGLRTAATGKLTRFFGELGALPSPVEQWIVATSPGFCSAFHWDWLLKEIERRIERYAAAVKQAVSR